MATSEARDALAVWLGEQSFARVREDGAVVVEVDAVELAAALVAHLTSDESTRVAADAVEDAERQWEFESEASASSRAYVDPGPREPALARAAVIAALGVTA